MQKIMIENPKKIERQINTFINNDPESKFIFRLCSLKIFLNEKTCSAEWLGNVMNTSPRSVSQWIHKINKNGDIEVLRDKAKPGRTSRLTTAQLELIRQHIQMKPEDLGINANMWDGKVLSHHILRNFGVKLQVRQCQRIFKKLGFSLKRARTVVANGNPKAKKAFKKTQEVT
jgi:transposase